MKALSSYPQPKENTGIGLHLSANAWDSRYYGDGAKRDMDTWRQMGVTWLKVLTGSDSQLAPVMEFVKGGFEVIVRFYAYQPHPGFVPAVDMMKRFADVGVHYVEGGNEPELPGEWDGHTIPADCINKLAHEYIRFADDSYRAGVIPLTYSIQGDRLNTWLLPLVREIKTMGRLDAIEGSVIGGHWRPGRMPVDSPPIDQTQGGVGFVFRSYEEWVRVIRAELGWCPPLIGTEALREPHEVDGDVNRHAADNVAIMQMKWLPELFCQCAWLWCPGGMGNEVSWVDNAKYVSPLPVVRAFIDMPKIIRNVTPLPMDMTNALVLAIGLAKESQIRIFPDAMSYKVAQANDFGHPETNEWSDGAWSFQKWERGVTAWPTGDTDHIKAVKRP
jgi:hypothetical protein